MPFRAGNFAPLEDSRAEDFCEFTGQRSMQDFHGPQTQAVTMMEGAATSGAPGFQGPGSCPNSQLFESRVDHQGHLFNEDHPQDQHFQEHSLDEDAADDLIPCEIGIEEQKNHQLSLFSPSTDANIVSKQTNLKKLDLQYQYEGG